MIRVQNVSKEFMPLHGATTKALQNVSFELPNDGLFFLIGKSGSGKSTLLNILGTIDKPTSGNIFFDNENITDYKEKKLLKIRNSKIGFVFQDFQLLEDLNVEDNIKLALGSTKNNQEIITKCLADVGLSGFEKRNINELSGGEKQRIAIARAIAKNPSIILADEPTGNLDAHNSINIFDLLKKISKRCLVVVVTHDKENADKYADGLLELQDGKLISNTINNHEKNVTKSLEKSFKNHTSLNILSKLSFGIIKKKKIRVTITSLLVTIAFSLFGFSLSLIKFDIPKTHAESMVKSNESEVIISKSDGNFKVTNALFLNDLEKILPHISSNYTILSELFVDNNQSHIKFGYNPEKEEIKKAAYYSLLDFSKALMFESCSEEQLKSLKIAGSIPTKSHEVLIPEILADYLVVEGFIAYNEENKLLPTTIDMTVDSKEELIDKKIWIDSTYVIIKGIVLDEGLSKFTELKQVSSNEIKITNPKLYEEFVTTYENPVIYINKNFFDVTDLESNNIIPEDLYKIHYEYNDKKYYEMYFTALIDEELTYLDETKENKIKSLKDNEIIISYMLLDEILNYDISNKTREEFIKAKDEYDKQVAKRDEEIKKQEEMLMNDPTYIYEEIPEIPEVDYKKITDDIQKEYFIKNNVLGSTITLNIKDNNGINSSETFTIAGYQNTQIYSFISNDFKEYTLPNDLTSSIKINESNGQALEEIFNEFPIDGKNYKSYTKFSDKMRVIESTVIRIKKIFIYVTIVFLIFSVALFGIFILNSIIVNKNKIGILKTLGLNTWEIAKIFIMESLIIGGISLFLSNILNALLIYLSNNYITKELFFYARPINTNPYIFVYILIAIVLTIIINFFIPTIVISKTKPINLIK